MSNKITQILNNINGIKDIKLEYSFKLKILYLFINTKIYIIDNITEDPKITKDLDINDNIIKTILHPKNENQLLIITNDSIYMILNLKKLSKKEEIKKQNDIPLKDIISIKFSYFDNCFGVLYKDRTFIYYLLKENNQLEEICNITELDNDYIDFDFCPMFSKGFEIFMVFFMTKDGTVNMYGPFFPNEFYIPKEYFFNMDNYLIYKLSLMDNDNKNRPENAIYCLSLNVLDDLKKSIIENDPNNDKDNDFIKISDKMKIFNSTFRKREIKIHNNFLINQGSDIFNKSYKQIHILNKKPLTIMRISDKNEIDFIMLGEEIMPLELARTGNFTFNVENNNNNFFIEYISLNNNNKEKEKMKIYQFNNEDLFIKTKNSLFLIKIPYLNSLKTIAEEQLKDIPNKMKKTTVIKLLKWNNDVVGKDKKKSIIVKDILIEPNLRKLYVFAILKECSRNQEITSLTLKIKEKSFNDEEKKSDLSQFDNIISEKTEYDNPINDIKNKLNENEFIDTKSIIKTQIVIDEKILENKKINFEDKLNNELNIIYKTYKDLIQNNDEVFNQKINIMKNIYNNLSQSQIKQTIDETIKKINKLKEIKNDILNKKEIIEKKIKSVKEKINKYELDEEEINNYLKILEEYQKTLEERLNGIDKKIEFFKKNIDKIFSFTDMFPNLDLDFNLIVKDYQDKYLEFEQKVMDKSKNMNQFFNENII